MKRSNIFDSFTISTETKPAGYDLPTSHYHIDYEIYILTHGQRFTVIDEDEYDTPAGSVCFFASMIPHRSFGNTPYSGICIHFSENYLRTFYSEKSVSRLLRCFDKKTARLSAEDLRTLKEMASNFVKDDQKNYLRLAYILELMQNACKYSKTSGRIIPAVQSRTDEIFQYVDENYASIRTAAELSDRFHISESYLYRIYRERKKTTLKSYINEKKIQAACNKLIYSNSSIRKIAESYNFTSYGYFVRVFKDLTGMTPSAYRNKSCSSDHAGEN